MKKSTKIYLASPICLLALSLYWRSNVISAAKLRHPPTALQRVFTPGFATNIHLAPQQITTRIWNSPFSPPSRQFHIPRASSPHRLLNFDGNLFLICNSDATIRQYTSDGTELHVYRPSKEEEANIPDFTISRDGVLWIALANAPLTRIKLSGENLGTVANGLHALTLTTAADSVFVAPVSSPALAYGDYLLIRFSPTGEISPIRSFLNDHARGGLAAIGISIGSDNSHDLYYLPRYAGLIAKYSEQGVLQYIVRTVVPRPTPTLEVTLRGATRFSNYQSEITKAATTYNNKLLVVTELQPDPKAPQEFRSLLDVYRTTDGAYEGSAMLPSRIKSICVLNHELYAAATNDVLVWPLPVWLK